MFRKLVVVFFSLFLLLFSGLTGTQKRDIQSLPGVEVKQVDGSGDEATCKIYRQVKNV